MDEGLPGYELIGMELRPVSTHDTVEEARTEHTAKEYSNDFVIVLRQLKVKPDNSKAYYRFDEKEIEG